MASEFRQTLGLESNIRRENWYAPVGFSKIKAMEKSERVAREAANEAIESARKSTAEPYAEQMKGRSQTIQPSARGIKPRLEFTGEDDAKAINKAQFLYKAGHESGLERLEKVALNRGNLIEESMPSMR